MTPNDTTPTRAETTDLPPGGRVSKKERIVEPLDRGTSVGGRYIVLDELGRGGMAIVYRAYDPELDRHLALKVILHRDVEGQASERLLREAQALAQLSHPNVVAVYDVGTYGSSLFVAMELVEGPTLRTWLRQTERTTTQILAAFVAAGEGLSAAHRARIVHRDFKPGNVLLGADGRVRVADFGLARSVTANASPSGNTPRSDASALSPAPAPSGAPSPPPANSPGTAAPHTPRAETIGREPASPNEEKTVEIGKASAKARTSTAQPSPAPPSPGSIPRPSSGRSPSPAIAESPGQLTAVGAILGTPEYMSPEQQRGEPVDELSDQYSFSISLFEALFGRRPIDGENPASAARQSSVRSGVPRRIRLAIARGLATDPHARFPTMDALLDELRPTPKPPRRAWTVATAVAFALTALFIGLRVRDGQKTFCRGAPEKLGSIWNADQKRSAEEAFEKSGLPYARHAFAAVTHALEAYTVEWSEGYVDACAATHIRGEQSEDMLDRRMACLEQRRIELSAAAELFAHADGTVVENAAKAANALSPVKDCADLGRLALRVMPARGDARASVERTWRELGRAKALLESGRYAEGAPLARVVAAQAAVLGYLPLEAEAQLTLAQFLDARGEYEAALHTLRQALRTADVSGAADVAARSWIDLVKVVGVRLSHYAEAHEWARDAEAHLGSASGPNATFGLLLSAEAALAYEESQFDRAVEIGERARALLERTLGTEAAAVADVQKTIGNAEAARGNSDAARVSYEQARTIWERSLGAAHPAVAAAWNNLATLLLERGRYEEALAHARHALEIWEGSLGTDHPSVAIARTNVGESLRALGDREGARIAFATALAIRQHALGHDHPLSAGNLANLGSVALDAGEYGAAERWFEQALAIWRARLGPKDLHVATALTGLGEALLGENRFARALATYQEALALETTALGSDHADLADPLAGLGLAYLGTGQLERARETTERALALAERHASDPDTLSNVRFALARALLRSGSDRTRGLALAAQARDGFAALGRRGERRKREAEALLADIR